MRQWQLKDVQGYDSPLKIIELCRVTNCKGLSGVTWKKTKLFSVVSRYWTRVKNCKVRLQVMAKISGLYGHLIEKSTEKSRKHVFHDSWRLFTIL